MRPLFCLLLATSACGSALPVEPPTFGDTERFRVDTTSGTRSLKVFEDLNHPLARGTNALRLELSDSRVEGVSLSVLPWMPVMGHGSAVTPTWSRDGNGFVVERLTLAMSGLWELRCDFTGEVEDHAVVSFELQ